MTSLPLKAIFSLEEFKSAELDATGRAALLNPSRDVMDKKRGQPDFKELPAYIYFYRIRFGAAGGRSHAIL